MTSKYTSTEVTPDKPGSINSSSAPMSLVAWISDFISSSGPVERLALVTLGLGRHMQICADYHFEVR